VSDDRDNASSPVIMWLVSNSFGESTTDQWDQNESHCEWQAAHARAQGGGVVGNPRYLFFVLYWIPVQTMAVC
jgi:hypothetical protein